MGPILHRYPVNRKGRTFISADQHGCLYQFRTLLNAIEFDYENDIMYSAADYADRGFNNVECIEQTQKPWLRGVRGNHDQLLIDSVYDPNFDQWRQWSKGGGNWAIRLPFEERKRLADILLKLPVVIVVGEGEERFNVFHGEFFGGDEDLDKLEFATECPKSLQWGRKLITERVCRLKQYKLSTSYVGHSIVRSPMGIDSHVYLDTGSYKAESGYPNVKGMCVIEHGTGRIWQYRS